MEVPNVTLRNGFRTVFKVYCKKSGNYEGRGIPDSLVYQVHRPDGPGVGLTRYSGKGKIWVKYLECVTGY